MSTFLKKFRADEIVINSEQAKSILKSIFPDKTNLIPAENLNSNQKAFAQALLVEAIEASNKGKLASDLMQTTIPKNIIGLVITAYKTYSALHSKIDLDNINIDQLKNGKISLGILTGIKNNFSREVDRVLQDVGLSYISQNSEAIHNNTKNFEFGISSEQHEKYMAMSVTENSLNKTHNL